MNNILCQRIGIYGRLSVRNTEREEMSIENQLLLVGQYLDQHNYGNVEICVDGSVSTERAKYMRQLGASIFVGGTAGIFKQGCILQDTIPLFMSYIK